MGGRAGGEMMAPTRSATHTYTHGIARGRRRRFVESRVKLGMKIRDIVY